MNGSAILIAGSRGTGKSTVARKLISKVHPDALMIYDVNAEYTDIYSKPLLEFNEFTAQMNKVKNGVILIEESTIFLDSRGNNFDMRSSLVRARHNNNVFIMVFHSMRSIPRYIYDLCNYIYILKTNDTPDIVTERFDNPELTNAFLHIKNAAWLQGENGKRYSPYTLFNLYK